MNKTGEFCLLSKVLFIVYCGIILILNHFYYSTAKEEERKKLQRRNTELNNERVQLETSTKQLSQSLYVSTEFYIHISPCHNLIFIFTLLYLVCFYFLISDTFPGVHWNDLI